MLALSQTTGYAILALSCLEPSEKKLVLAKDIAERTGIPKPYLSKILHALSKSGLIDSKRGYRGGVGLSRPAAQISVLEVAEAVRGREWEQTCLMGMAECRDERACPLHDFWVKERAKIEARLRKVTLDEVSSFERDWRHWISADEPARGRGKRGATAKV